LLVNRPNPISVSSACGLPWSLSGPMAPLFRQSQGREALIVCALGSS
jgi:hypothetical protein